MKRGGLASLLPEEAVARGEPSALRTEFDFELPRGYLDASGTLPSGQSFKGASELKQILLAKKDLFARCFSEKMLTYALGRGVEFYDRPAVDRIVAGLAKSDYRFSALVVEIVQSDPFRMRRGKDPK